MRFANGSQPLSGVPKAHFDVWCRLVDEEGVEPETAFLALADCLPPAAMVQFPKMAPVSTVTWSIDLFAPVTTRGWHLLRSDSEQSADGYALEAMSVWNGQGQRVAVARQVVALFL